MSTIQFSAKKLPQIDGATNSSVKKKLVVLVNKNPVPNTKELELENQTPREFLISEEEYLEDIKILTATALRKKYPKTYDSWRNTKQRCKKGWILDHRFEKFSNFLKLMGPKRGKSVTLDRIDYTNLNYSPENCRWANKYTQNQNKSNNVLLTYKGETYCATVWAKKSEQKPDTVLHRKANGWSDEEAITGIRKSTSALSIEDARRLCLQQLPLDVLCDASAQIRATLRSMEEECHEHWLNQEEKGIPIPEDVWEKTHTLREIYKQYIGEIIRREPQVDLSRLLGSLSGKVGKDSGRGIHSKEFGAYRKRLDKLTGKAK